MSQPADWRELYRGRPVLVLGATGFVGRWLAHRLGGLEAELTLCVRSRAKAEPLFEMLGVRGTVVELDLVHAEGEAAPPDAPDLSGLIAEIRPDITFNLAGYGVDPAETDPELAERVNHRLVGELAKAIARTPGTSWEGPRLVHAGSALEYGSAGGDLEESTEPRPTTPYGTTKLAGTRLLREIAGETGLPALTARLFTVYGPGEHAGRLLPSLIAAARTEDEVALTEGRQRRDFTYVEDVAGGLVRLGVCRSEAGEAVNLATGVLTSVREFVEIASRVLGISAERLRFGALPTRPEEMAHDPISIERLEQLTSWRPATSIEAGVKRVLRFERRHGAWPSE